MNHSFALWFIVAITCILTFDFVLRATARKIEAIAVGINLLLVVFALLALNSLKGT